MLQSYTIEDFNRPIIATFEMRWFCEIPEVFDPNKNKWRPVCLGLRVDGYRIVRYSDRQNISIGTFQVLTYKEPCFVKFGSINFKDKPTINLWEMDYAVGILDKDDKTR